jgi:hypothetical protein
MRKLASFLFGFVVLFFISAFPSYAYDLEVSCGNVGCSSFPPGPLFSENNGYPGWSVSKTVRGINDYGQTGSFAVEVLDSSDLDNLADVFQVGIRKTGEMVFLFTDSLDNFLKAGYVSLSDIGAGAYQDYDFIVSMDSSANNDYQDLKLSFDLALGFEILEPASEGGAGGGVAVSSVDTSPAVCGATAPLAPTGLSAAVLSDTEISLSWTAPSEPVTHYAVSYGTVSGTPTYGNSNIGNTTSYIVSQLGSGTTYYFVVYAVNDCASSGASSEVSATTTGLLGAFTEGPAPGFDVLGESQNASEEGELGGGMSTGVAGTSREKLCYWSLIFALFALILSVLILSRFKKRQTRQLLVPAVLSLLAFLADRYMHQWYFPSIFCDWMWLVAFFVFLLCWLFWRQKSS